MDQGTKITKNKALRRKALKLNKIRRNGFFVHMPMCTLAKENEPEVKLWRAVIDRNLKDIIEHLLLVVTSVNVSNYRDARDWFEDDYLGVGVVAGLAFVNENFAKEVARRIEKQAQDLKEQGVDL